MRFNHSVRTLLFRVSVALNRIVSLGRGFGACPMLEVLDVTHNNLSEDGLSANFWMMGKKCAPVRFLAWPSNRILIVYSFVNIESLRALYLGDNFLRSISPEIGRLRNLQIVSFEES